MLREAILKLPHININSRFGKRWSCGGGYGGREGEGDGGQPEWC